jgi:flagellar basal body-associated protein FliL
MMTSSRMPEDGEQLSRDESGEIEDEERKAISEGDNSWNFTGQELAELEESKDEEGQSIPEEDNAESSAGEKIEDAENESTPEKGHSKGTGSRYVNKTNLALFIFIIIGLVFLLGIGYFYAREEKSHINPDQNDRIPHQKEQKAQLNPLGIPKDQLLVLHSFVIPFEENKRFTYISLSISFKLPNKELKREMIEKKHQLR